MNENSEIYKICNLKPNLDKLGLKMRKNKRTYVIERIRGNERIILTEVAQTTEIPLIQMKIKELKDKYKGWELRRKII